jgi:hypothetical protein
MNRSIRGAAIGFLVAAAALASAAPYLHAQSAGASCVIRGKPTLPATLSIYDKELDGRVIARFTGAPTPLVASNFPASAARRVAVETGSGSGSFRIKGFVESKELPIYTANTVPVVANHVWIGAHELVSPAGSSAGRLKVSRNARKPLKGNFVGSAACSAFTLTPGVRPGWNVPGNARGYVVKQSSIELFDGPGGTAIQTISRSPEGGGILLWSGEQRAGWVQVEYHEDIVIEAWARGSDLAALPPGETMDQARDPSTQRGTPRLAVGQSVRTVTTRQEIPIRTEPKESAPVIGRIEPDTETLVMDIVAGWTSVLPKSLHVAPAADEQFWVPSKQL